MQNFIGERLSGKVSESIQNNDSLISRFLSSIWTPFRNFMLTDFKLPRRQDSKLQNKIPHVSTVLDCPRLCFLLFVHTSGKQGRSQFSNTSLKFALFYYNFFCNCRSVASEASEGTTLYNRTVIRFSHWYVLKEFSHSCAEFVCGPSVLRFLTRNWYQFIGN